MNKKTSVQSPELAKKLAWWHTPVLSAVVRKKAKMGRCAEVRGQVPTAVLSFHRVGGSFRPTQVLVLGGRQDYVLSHLVDPL